MITVREFMMVLRPWLDEPPLAWYWHHQFVGDRVHHEHFGDAPYWSA